MSNPVHILLVEDAVADAELAQREIRKVVKDCVFQRVDTRKEFLKALETFRPDIILSDYNMPRFDGMKALGLALEHAPLTPFIIWTGSMSEDIAVDCMRAGANNYIIKENVKRLGPAVVHALGERRILVERKRAKQRYQDIFEHSADGIFQSTPEGRFLSVNPAMARIYGYDSPQDMIESVTDIAYQLYFDPTEREEFVRQLQAQGTVENYEWQNYRKDGTIIWTLTSARIVRNADGKPLYYEGFLQDVTRRKQAELRYRALFEQAHDAIFILDLEGRTLDVNQRAADMLGYSYEEMLGLSVKDLSAEPERSGNALQRLVNGETLPPYERRFRKKDGSIVLVEINAELVCDARGTPLHIQSIVRDITERKQAEEKIIAQEKHFRSLIENSLDNISLLAEDGTLLWENPAVNRTLGYEQDEYVGRSIFELMHPDDLGWTTDTFAKLLKKPGEHKHGIFRLLHRDGTWRWIEAVATNLLNEPSVGAVVINYRDITERKQAEIEIQQRNDDLGLLNAINAAVIRGESLNMIVNLLAKEMKRIFSSEGSTIYMLDPDGQSLTMQQYYMSSALTKKIEGIIGGAIPLVRIPIKEGGFFQKVLHSSRGTITSDPHEIQEWMGEFAETTFLPSAARGMIRKLIPQIYKILNIKSTIIVPLVSNGQTIGLLDVSSPGLFTENDLKRIESIGSQLTAAIQRQQANERIQRSEEFLQKVKNALSASIVILDKDGIIVRVNSAWRKFGEQNGFRHPEHGIGLNYLEVCDSATGPSAEDAQIVANAIRDVIAGRISDAQIEYSCHSPREKRWFTLQITKFDDGDQAWVVLAHENITERKQAENALRESENRLILALSAAQMSVWEWNLETNGLIWSPEFFNITGTSQDDFGKNRTFESFTNLIHPQDVDRVRRSAEKAVADNDLFVEEFRILRPDGEIRWLSNLGHADHDPVHNQLRLLGTIQDITSRKQAEQALHESERRYRGLFENTPIAIWEEDFSEVKKHLDSLKQQGITDFRAYFASHPEAVTECTKMIKVLDVNSAALQMFEADSKGELIEETMRVLSEGEQEHNLEDFIAIAEGRTSNGWEGADDTLKGRPLQISLTWSVAPGYEADYSKVIVATVDVTERKRAEEKLRASDERFRQLADNIQEVFWMTDVVNDKELYISPAAEKTWGHPPESLMQRSVSFLDTILPEDLPVVLPILEKQRKGEQTDMEYRIKRPDGSVRWIWDRAFPIFDDSGNLVRVAGIAADITERKQAEDALREERDRFTKIAATAPGMIATLRLHPDGSTDMPYASAALENLYGLQPKQVLHDASPALSLIHPADMEHVSQKMAESARDMALFHDEWRVQHPRRGEIWVEGNTMPVREPDGTITWHGFILDITSRKQTENALRESQVRFAGVVNSAMDAIISIDSEQRIVLFNPAAEQMFGCKITEALGQPIERFIPNRYRAAHKKHIADFGQTGTTSRDMGHLGSLRGLRVDDTEFPIEASISHIEVGTQHLYTVILRDITERKHAEEALRQSEERYRQLLDTAPVGVAVHAEGKLVFANTAGARIVGADSPQELLGMPIMDFVHPDERQQTLGILQRMLKGEKGLYPREERFVCLDGSIIHVEVTATPLTYMGKPAVQVIVQDISERKQTEAQLRKLSRAVEQSASTIVITDTDGSIEYVNPKFTETTGYTSQEAIGQNPRILKSNQTPQQEYERLWKTITSGQEWHGDLLNRRKNGELYWESATISPIFNERGETTHFIAVKEEITERKQAEKESQRHLAELEALYENGLAVGQLLEPREIGERIISTFNRYLSWHHVTIRLLKSGSDDLELVAYSLPHLEEAERNKAEQNFVKRISKVGQGMSGWVVQTGKPIRTGNVHDYPQYVDVYEGIQSGLYMPLTIGKRVIGVISVESEELDAFNSQDERLLATLANQAAVAFENARLYQSAQQELTERKRVENALRSSETHYRELADSITDVFFELDHDMRYTHWNRASEMLTGVAEKDAIGRTMQEIFGDSEEQSRIGNIYASVLKNHRSRAFETIIPLNHEKLSFEINAYPSTRGVAVVAKDVTERKRSEILQQKRFELMEYSAHNTLDDLMRKTMDEISELTGSEIGFFHFMEDDQNTPGSQVWSTNALKLFNIPVSEGMHRSVDQAGAWAEAVRQRRPLIHNEFESLPQRKGMPEGHVSIVREIVIPVIRNEKIMAVMGVANKPQEYTQQDLEIASRLADYSWDITERKRMQADLADERNQLAQRVEERTAELIKANTNLARALRVKDEFLANMSHELRTPLNAILGLSESLAEQIAGPLNEKQLKYITTISESGHHLLSLINDILDLAKIEAGQITLDINKVDIHAVCQASLRMVRQLAQKKNQEMLLTIDDNIGLMWADERRLKQMIVNLLSNAVKFTPVDGVLGLDVHGYKNENRVEISVWDNGVGIRENDIAFLFQPFVQLDSGLARESTGTGLGLALVSQMARLHGGSVAVTSEPGKGSRFTISLPWEPVLARETVERLRNTGRLGPSETEPGNKKKILLVEDTVEVTMMIMDYLETAGYTVTTAQDGIEGINQAKLTHPDLILMDIQMPRMDGIEATKRLRADPQFKYIPIIALTALAMPNDRERCIEAGMDEYISKPVNLRTLVRIIQKCLSPGEERTRPL